MRLAVIRTARDQIRGMRNGLVVTSRLPENNPEREARFRQRRIELTAWRNAASAPAKSSCCFSATPRL